MTTRMGQTSLRYPMTRRPGTEAAAEEERLNGASQYMLEAGQQSGSPFMTEMSIVPVDSGYPKSAANAGSSTESADSSTDVVATTLNNNKQLTGDPHRRNEVTKGAEQD